MHSNPLIVLTIKIESHFCCYNLQPIRIQHQKKKKIGYACDSKHLCAVFFSDIISNAESAFNLFAQKTNTSLICIRFVFGREYISKFHVYGRCSLLMFAHYFCGFWFPFFPFIFQFSFRCQFIKIEKKRKRRTIKLGFETMNEWHLCMSVYATQFTVHAECRMSSTNWIYELNAESRNRNSDAAIPKFEFRVIYYYETRRIEICQTWFFYSPNVCSLFSVCWRWFQCIIK